jgi:hypothetical protein
MTRLNENEYGPLQPRMLPAARILAPTCRRGDRVADRGQRQQRAVAVAHGGDAVAEIDLRRLEDDLLLPRLVATSDS